MTDLNKQIVEQHARMEMILVRLLQMCMDADHLSGNGTISARLVREYALEGLREFASHPWEAK